MTVRERIQTALRGGRPDQVPWTIYSGLLPQGETAERLKAQGLGVVLSQPVFTAEYPNLEVEERWVEENGQSFRVQTWRTPVGELTQRARLEPGYGSWWTVDHLVKELRDYEVLEFIIRDAVLRPSYEGFQQAEQSLGETGLLMTGVERVPFQRLWIQYTGLERLILDLHTEPGVVEQVLAAMREKDEEAWALVAASPAEFIWCPDNISGVVTGPPLFDRYCRPHYEALARVMHPRGKRLFVHMDGLMRRLRDSVRALPIDIVEAFTPPPDGDLSVAEARRAWEGKALSLNFPSSMHWAPPEEIKACTRQLIDEAAPGDGFLIGVTENIPAQVWERSLTAITETVNEYGRWA